MWELLDILFPFGRWWCKWFHYEKHWKITKTEWHDFAECFTWFKCEKCGRGWAPNGLGRF